MRVRLGCRLFPKLGCTLQQPQQHPGRSSCAWGAHNHSWAGGRQADGKQQAGGRQVEGRPVDGRRAGGMSGLGHQPQGAQELRVRWPVIDNILQMCNLLQTLAIARDRIDNMRKFSEKW